MIINRKQHLAQLWAAYENEAVYAGIAGRTEIEEHANTCAELAAKLYAIDNHVIGDLQTKNQMIAVLAEMERNA